MNNKPNTIKDLKQLLIKAKIPELYYNVPSDDMFFCDTVTYLKIKNNDGFEIGVFERILPRDTQWPQMLIML